MSIVVQFLSSEFNAIGIIGVILVLLAYLLLQINKLSQNSITFSLMNLLGSGLILLSLFYSWNLASVIIESAWLLVSLFGLSKAIHFFLHKKHHSASHHDK